jgi:hypothetical protein
MRKKKVVFYFRLALSIESQGSHLKWRTLRMGKIHKKEKGRKKQKKGRKTKKQ